MGFSSRAFAFVSRFPLKIPIFSKSSEQKLLFHFTAAGIGKIDAKAYLTGSLFISSVLSIAAFAVSLFFLTLLESTAGLLLCFSLLFAAFLLAPQAAASRRTKLAESQLPFLLRELAVYIDIGLAFEKCMEKIAEKDYVLSNEFLRAFKSIKSGSTVQSALADMSSSTKSLTIKRAILMLSSIYETGAKAESLKRTAEELSASQLSQMRTQSSRFSLLAILFIAASALIPSFFTVFAAVSPMILSSPFYEWQIWLAFLFIFPVLNFVTLGTMFLLLPPAREQAPKHSRIFDEYLKEKGFSYGRQAFALLLTAVSLSFAAFFFASQNLVLFALSLCIAPAAYSVASYLSHRQVQQAELLLPDALYSAASTHKLLSAEKMLLFLSKAGFGRVSEAFGIALRRQKTGESFSDSLKAAYLHCPSPLVKRAFSLLVVSYETGANMYFALREAAQDVVSFFALVRERSALLSVQRYTILASSSVLVPAILGAVVFLAPSLSGGQGTLFSSLVPACQAYLLINALVSSLLLSFAETDLKKSAMYFAFVAPLSQVTFLLSSSGAIDLFLA